MGIPPLPVPLLVHHIFNKSCLLAWSKDMAKCDEFGTVSPPVRRECSCWYLVWSPTRQKPTLYILFENLTSSVGFTTLLNPVPLSIKLYCCNAPLLLITPITTTSPRSKTVTKLTRCHRSTNHKDGRDTQDRTLPRKEHLEQRTDGLLLQG